MNLYFFMSSKRNDVVNNITIATSNPVRAYALACNYFTKYQAKGKPRMLAI